MLTHLIHTSISRNSSASIANGYELEDRGSTGRDFPFRYYTQTETGAHPASHPMSTEERYPEDEAVGVCETHLMPRLKNVLSLYPLPQTRGA